MLCAELAAPHSPFHAAPCMALFRHGKAWNRANGVLAVISHSFAIKNSATFASKVAHLRVVNDRLMI